MVFEHVEQRYPVLAGGLHAHLATVPFEQPVAEREQVRVEGLEAPLLVGRDALGVGRGDGGDDHALVHVDAAADWVDDLH